MNSLDDIPHEAQAGQPVSEASSPSSPLPTFRQFDCVECGEPITYGPTLLISSIVLPGGGVDRTTLTTVDGEEEAAIRCPRCRDVLDSPTTREQLTLRANLPVPPTAFVQQIVGEGRKDDSKLRGLSMHLFGARVSGLPLNPPYPALAIDYEVGRKGLEFLLVLRMVRIADPPVTMRVRWHRDWGELPLEIVGWEACLGKDEWGRLAVAANLLHEWGQLTRRGRKRGSTTWEEKEFREQLAQARESLFKRNGRPPANVELAAELGMSEATFYRYLSKWRDSANN